MNRRKLTFLVPALLFTIVVVFLLWKPNSVPPSIPDLTATLSEVEGQALARQLDQESFEDAFNGLVLEPKGQVSTLADGRARVDFSTGTLVRVGPHSTCTLETVEEHPTGIFTRLQLTLGEIWIILNGGEVEVDTPAGLATVRGSHMNVKIEETTQAVRVTCLSGRCEVTNPAGHIVLGAGQAAQILNDAVPPKAEPMTDSDIARWLKVNPEASAVIPSQAPATDIPTPSTTPTPMAQATPTIPIPSTLQTAIYSITPPSISLTITPPPITLPPIPTLTIIPPPLPTITLPPIPTFTIPSLP